MTTGSPEELNARTLCGVDRRALGSLLTRQDGVICRAQFEAAVGQPFDLQRLVRRRELVRLLPGVFVDHTGIPTWQQRAVGGVLYAGSIDEDLWPVGAALGGHSAMRAALSGSWRHETAEAPPTICIDPRRSLRPAPGYVFRRRARLGDAADWLVTPPRLRPEQAVLDLASDLADPWASVGLLADACQSRRTSAARILVAMQARERIAHRAQLAAILADLDGGTSSVLEHQFLRRVVRAHGLPEPARQSVRHLEQGGSGRREYRDHEWLDLGVVVELDGLAFHNSAAQRDADLDRDLDDAVGGRLAVRLGWGQVSRRPCATAAKLAAILAARGWPEPMRRCPHCSNS